MQIEAYDLAELEEYLQALYVDLSLPYMVTEPMERARLKDEIKEVQAKITELKGPDWKLLKLSDAL